MNDSSIPFPLSPYHDPFGTRYHDPFGTRYHDPFGTRYHDPFGTRYHDPFGTRYHDPFGTRYHDLFGTRYHDPFGTRYHDPFGTRYHDPFGTRSTRKRRPKQMSVATTACLSETSRCETGIWARCLEKQRVRQMSRFPTPTPTPTPTPSPSPTRSRRNHPGSPSADGQPQQPSLAHVAATSSEPPNPRSRRPQKTAGSAGAPRPDDLRAYNPRCPLDSGGSLASALSWVRRSRGGGGYAGRRGRLVSPSAMANPGWFRRSRVGE
jgi:hypothetical protein